MKSYGQKVLPQKRQPLSSFTGTQSLGVHAGFSPKHAGAICDPAAFTGVVKVPMGILGPRDGAIAVDLVAPGSAELPQPFEEVVIREVFSEGDPQVVITVGRFKQP